MGFLDRLKGTANIAKEKAAEAVDQHGPQIKEGIGKAGGYLDKKTKGKYSDKIAQGTQKAGEAVDNTNKSAEPSGETSGGPSAGPVPPAPHLDEPHPHAHEPHEHVPHPPTPPSPPPAPAQPDQPL